MSTSIHLHPTAPLAERVLLPGDPGRALRLAQALLDEPRMFNHNRGLWGYSGTARADGEPLSIQSTGMGGPSTAIVVSELIDLGARTLMRVGTCGALAIGLSLGQLVIASEALADDGTSRALGVSDRIAASPVLVGALQEAGENGLRSGPVVSTDLFYGAEDRESGWLAAGALAVEMEAATLFALAARHEARAGCALIVSDLLFDGRERIGAEALEAAELELGELAVRALGA